ncbi:MAG: outer membrane beta-barrel protein [Mucilaginibacter sp.]
MKKIILLSAFMCFCVFAIAQSSTYKAFKVDIGFGYADPTGQTGSGVKAGVTFTLEPHYRLSDAISVGLRIEGAGLGYEDNANSDNSSVKVSILTSYCPTFEYYFMNGGFRPFIGAGAGIFSQQSTTVDSNTDTSNGVVLTPGGSKFGFFPRAGFEAGHFRLSAEYDALGNSSSYAAIKIGFFLGGGKK